MEHLHFFEALERKFLYNTKKSMVYTVDDFSEEFIKLYLSGKSLEEIKIKFHDIDKEKLEKIYNFIKKADEKEFFSNEEIEVEISNEKEVEVDSITLILTNRCNLCCTYCFEGEKVNKDMTKETVEKVIDYLVEKLLSEKIKSANISFFGGEPLLKFDLIKYAIAYIESKDMIEKFTFGITTNGTIANEEITEFFKKYNFNVMISIDGPKEIHDIHRVYGNNEGSLDKVIENYDKYLKKLNPQARATLYKDNLDYVTVNDFLLEKGFKRNVILCAATSDEKSRVSEKDFNIIIKSLEESLSSFIKDFLIDKSEIIPYFLNIAPLVIFEGGKKISCNAGFRDFAIENGGDVYICHRFINNDIFGIGNISDISVLEKNLGKFKKNVRLNAETKCGGCFAIRFCRGGCYHENYVEKDNIFDNGNNCILRKKKTELILALYGIIAENNINLLKKLYYNYDINTIRWFPLNGLLKGE